MNCFFRDSMTPDPPNACCNHGHSYAGPKTTFFSLTGLESLKLSFSKFNLNLILLPCELFNYKVISNNLSCPRGVEFSAISCPAWCSGAFVAFCALLKLIPSYIPGWGGGSGSCSGFTLTGALAIVCLKKSLNPSLLSKRPCTVLCILSGLS